MTQIVLITFFTITYIGLITAFAVGLRRVLAIKKNEVGGIFKLSLIVVFRDEESFLPALLDAISNQTLSEDFFEFILVDDHSSDSSLSVAKSYQSKFRNLKVVKPSANFIGKKAALAQAIGLASNPVIVVTDADCVPSKFWLESISIYAGKGSHFIIGGVMMNPINSFIRKIQALEYSSLMATAAGSCGIGHPVISSSANLAFRNDLLKVDTKTLNLNVASGDDMFLLHSAKKLKGCRIVFLNDERATVRTSTEPNIWKALKQRARWASKSFHYKDFDTIATGFIVLIFNILLAALLFASIFDMMNLFYLFILLIIKSAVDYSLIGKYLKFTGQETLLKVFIPLQLVYPFYIVYSFFTGILIKGNWKGRSIQK